MTTQSIPIFKAMGAKMEFLNQRQGVLAHNIANADTPGYRPRDLVDVDFGRVLQDVVKDNRVRLNSTDNSHMPQPNEVPDAKNKKQRMTYEVAPAENAVIIEEQMIKAGRNTADYNLMSNLYAKHVNMMRIALGQGGR